MISFTNTQMAAGRRSAHERFVTRTAGSIARRYQIPPDAALTAFVEERRAMGIAMGFETDRQVADFVEACFLTRDAILTDAAFQTMMQRPLLRAEAKAGVMLRHHVWPNPAWHPETDESED
jgi:hypothetical protein